MNHTSQDLSANHRSWRAPKALFAGVWALVGIAAPVAAQAPLAPLSEEHRGVLDSIESEGTEPPEQHYFRSNEWRQDLLRPHLEGRGGALVGVGSDQNYTMAAMAGSSLIFVVDYDPRIPWIHEIYRVLVQASSTPEELIARFAPENERETRALLERGLEDHPRAAAIVRHWQGRRSAWFPYLRRVSRLVRDGRPFSWLADESMYRHVRSLFEGGRVFARNGDVTVAGTLRAVGRACRQVGIPVRVVYFSNAEQFFLYTSDFVENMDALPTDSRSVVVRTIRHRDTPVAADGRWHFVVQDFTDFEARLATGAYRRSFALTADLLSAGPPHLGRDGLSRMTSEVPHRMAEAAQDDSL